MISHVLSLHPMDELRRGRECRQGDTPVTRQQVRCQCLSQPFKDQVSFVTTNFVTNVLNRCFVKESWQLCQTHLIITAQHSGVFIYTITYA